MVAADGCASMTLRLAGAPPQIGAHVDRDPASLAQRLPAVGTVAVSFSFSLFSGFPVYAVFL